MTSVKITYRTNVPPSWPSAGIVDARAFTVGNGRVIHALTHASSNMVRGACGVSAPVVESDRPLACWSASLPTCLTCRERER